jgi:choice-of-anchor A domain-containing protein
MRKFSFITAALLAAATCAPANATTTFTAAQYKKAQNAIKQMQTTNLVVFGNANMSSDVEGKTYIGGDLSGGGTFGVGNASKTAKTWALARTLTVGGNMTANINVNNGAGVGTVGALDVAVGGNSTGTIGMNTGSAGGKVEVGGTFNAQNFNPNGKKTATYGVSASNLQQQDKSFVKQDTKLKAGGSQDLKAAIAHETSVLTDEMTTLSQILGALTPNATLNSSNQNSIQFNFSADAVSGAYAVANITASQLASGTFFLPQYASTKTLIVNVSGTSVNFGANAAGSYPGSDQTNIIYNFLDATSIQVNTAIYGSILAPKATITGSQQLNGSVVAKVFNYQGEVHLGTFAGQTPFLVTVPHNGGGGGNSTGDVPEPASWMTMLLGFGFLGSIIRRQRRTERLAAA